MDYKQIILDLHKQNKIKSKTIDELLKPSAEERSNNAEISTPYNLRQDMINLMVEYGDKDFWKTPKKVLEPTCGKGGFLLDIVDQFLKGGLDYKTIVEECLYFADINPENIYICKLLLDPYGEYKLNYYEGDSLKYEPDFKFDLVIGNPPYQSQSGNKGLGNTLWDKFVLTSLKKWLKEKGYLCLVHPQGWRQLNNKIGKIMLKNQLHYLNMNDVKKGRKLFRCSTTFDYYLMINSMVTKSTKINDYKNKEYNYELKNIKFIPNHSFQEVNDILDMNYKKSFIRDHSSYSTLNHWISKEQSEEIKYPCIYTINKNNELSLRWSNRNDKGHFGITKFIISNGSGFYKDNDGIYGCTEWAYYIPCKKEDMNDIKKCFKNSNFLNIIDAVKLTSNKYNYVILKHLKKDFWKEFI